jgi:CRISPR-associated protein Cas1
MGSTTRIRRAQLQMVNSPTGIQYGLQWIRGKFENQLKFLTAMRERRTRLSAEITVALNTIQKTLDNSILLMVPSKRCASSARYRRLGRQSLLGYFRQVRTRTLRFQWPQSPTAKDEFNAMLNYGYGVLYGTVEKAVVVAGLIPISASFTPIITTKSPWSMT